MKRLIVLLACLISVSAYAQLGVLKLPSKKVYQVWRGDTLKQTLYGDSIVWDGTSKYFVIDYDSIFLPNLPSVAIGTDGNGKLVQDTTCVCLLHKKVTIAHAAILTLNSSPVLLVADPGAGYAIKVVDVSVSIDSVGSVQGIITPYATCTNLHIITNTVTNPQYIENTVLTSGINITCSSALAANGEILPNQGLYITVNSGDPTNGAAGQYIVIDLIYRIIEY